MTSSSSCASFRRSLLKLAQLEPDDLGGPMLHWTPDFILHRLREMLVSVCAGTLHQRLGVSSIAMVRWDANAL